MKFEEVLNRCNATRYQKLTPSKLHKIWDIRARAYFGEDLTNIGSDYGLTKSLVSLVASGKRYADVLTPTGKLYCPKAYKATVDRRQGWNKHYLLLTHIVNQEGITIYRGRITGTEKEVLLGEIYQTAIRLGFLPLIRLSSSVFLYTFTKSTRDQGLCTLTVTIQED